MSHPVVFARGEARRSSVLTSFDPYDFSMQKAGADIALVIFTNKRMNARAKRNFMKKLYIWATEWSGCEGHAVQTVVAGIFKTQP